MSTRSMIARRYEDGSFRAVYAHWDGYPEHNGRILLSHYSDVNKLNALLDEGDISILRETVGDKHNFDDFGQEAPANKNEWTTFYGRDRGEEGCEACTFETLDELMYSAKERWSIYVYVFDTGEMSYGSWSFVDSHIVAPQDLAEHLRRIDLEETA
jgi:hypothetical protein